MSQTFALQIRDVDSREPGAYRLVFFEADADIDEIYEALAEDGVIRGKRLITAKRKDGEVYVKFRQDVVYTREFIGSVMPSSAPGAKNGVAA